MSSSAGLPSRGGRLGSQQFDPQHGDEVQDRAAVPAGTLLLLGDNAAWSLDSRHFGCVPADRVLGRVVRYLRAVRPAGGPVAGGGS
ncbi:S26 family signal peptidase [Embleya sp. NBC_00896]|uniref:S26 family signal peptidase n=1 Tax=Embleya sp. NBC_00896 TaxID=2975961 RepID=UPI00386C479C|nr:S26 family signal peptidase [Embleya sp. NBC_00896]